MAVLKKIRSRLFPINEMKDSVAAPAQAPSLSEAANPPVAFPATGEARPAPRRVGSREVNYRICPLTAAQLDEVWRLDQRCFVDGEAYSRDTFEYLLTAPECVAYRIVMPEGAMVGFIVGLVEPSATGHITTLGVAPEHRRRHIARRMLEKIEAGFKTRGCTSVRLEVRTVNIGAQKLYAQLGYTMTQRLPKYYSNGGDGLLMIKSIN